MATRSVFQKKVGQKTSKNATDIHTPTLKTIQMVESVLVKEKEFSSRNRLSRVLPKQVQPKTIETILRYLEASNKIMRDKTGAIIWIFGEDNPKLMKLHQMSTELK